MFQVGKSEKWIAGIRRFGCHVRWEFDLVDTVCLILVGKMIPQGLALKLLQGYIPQSCNAAREEMKVRETETRGI